MKNRHGRIIIWMIIAALAISMNPLLLQAALLNSSASAESSDQTQAQSQTSSFGISSQRSLGTQTTMAAPTSAGQAVTPVVNSTMANTQTGTVMANTPLSFHKPKLGSVTSVTSQPLNPATGMVQDAALAPEAPVASGTVRYLSSSDFRFGRSAFNSSSDDSANQPVQ